MSASAAASGDEAAVPAGPTPFAPEQEVRFAVVMYGGVSLAIYINGVVQELLRLVRATAPAQPLEDNPSAALLDAESLEGTERVYRQLGQLIEWNARRPLGAALRTERPAPTDPIRTRFVVDIMSGSSAGGINAIYLGKALANGQRVDSMKQLWVDEGDIALLINDRDSLDGLAGLAQQKPPQSVLNSRRMYWKLLAALREMAGGLTDAPSAGSSFFVDELDVWITATDIRGLLLPIDLYDRVVFEKRYRNVFHFRYASPFATGDAYHENDFVQANDPFLAFAGRATAAFPFAFEPMALEDIDEVLHTDSFRSDYDPGDHGSNAERWEKFFREYVSAGAGDRWYRRQAFGDGGYLDNKPFTWSTQTLMRRRADRPVDRRLIYIEPDPSGPFSKARPPGDPQRLDVPLPGAQLPPSEKKPNAIANVRAAALSLPRKETIRDDLQTLLARNKDLARLRRLAAAADSAVGTLWQPLDRDAWLAKPIDELVMERGAAYLTYHRLKVIDLLDDLAALVVALLELETGSAEQSAIRCLLQAWFDLKRRAFDRQKRFLLDFDFRYRLRRLNFLQDRIDLFLRRDDEALALVRRLSGRRVKAATLDDQFAADLIELKGELNGVFIELRGAARGLRRLPPDDPVRQALAAVQVSRPDLLRLLYGAPDDEASVANAEQMLTSRPDLAQQLDATARALAARTRPLFRAASHEAYGALESRLGAGAADGKRALAAAAAALVRLWDHYEEYDSVTLPIAYGNVGEADRVEVIRISPEDATDLLDVRSGRRKLGGDELNHFGGFFKRAWRRNDLMWGRLDAAEILIKTLLPTDEFAPELRAALLGEAQLAIVEDEIVGSGETSLASLFVDEVLAAERAQDGSARGLGRLVRAQTPAALGETLQAALDPIDVLEYLRTSFSVDRSLEPEETARTAARGTTVVGRLFDGLGVEYAKSPARWLTRLGRIALGLVELATPRRTMRQILYRYWLQLAVVAAVLMIAGGALFGAPATAKAGWILLGLALIVRVAAWLFADALAPGRLRLALLGLLPLLLGLPWVLAGAAAVWDGLGEERPAILAGVVGAAFLLIVLSPAVGTVLRSAALVTGAALAVVVIGLAVVEVWRHLESDADRAVCAIDWDWGVDAVQRAWPWDDGRCPEAQSGV